MPVARNRKHPLKADHTSERQMFASLMAERVGLTRAILALAPSGRAARVQFGCPAELSNPLVYCSWFRIPVESPGNRAELDRLENSYRSVAERVGFEPTNTR